MRSRWLADYWLGCILSASLIVSSLWLAFEGKLVLYIHPRYVWFTVVLCVIALICMILEAATHHRRKALRSYASPWSITGSAICIIFCLVAVTLRPASLTSSSAGQRGINTAALTNTDMTADDLRSPRVDYTQFTIKEWASLLHQTNDAVLFTGKPASLSGFISPTPDNNTDVFYLSRFIMTCCTIDAQPIGVPVYMPAWRKMHQTGQWIALQGSFIQNPNSTSNSVILKPTAIERIQEPDQPYAY